jgi:hypothetical protein
MDKPDWVDQHPVYGFGGVAAKFAGEREEVGWDPGITGSITPTSIMCPNLWPGTIISPGPASRPAPAPVRFGGDRSPYNAAGEARATTPPPSRGHSTMPARRGGHGLPAAGPIPDRYTPVRPRGVELRGRWAREWIAWEMKSVRCWLSRTRHRHARGPMRHSSLWGRGRRARLRHHPSRAVVWPMG